MRPAALYGRFSPRRNAADCESIETQLVAMRHYCSLVGLAPDQILEDHAVSGDTPIEQRPAGAKLVDLIRTRAVKDVVIAKLDRCFRDVVDCLVHVTAWDKAGCSLHIVNFGGATINTRSAMGRTMLTIGAAFAELEKNLIRERTSEGMLRHQACGRRMSRHTPFGWEDDTAADVPRHPETGRPLRMRLCEGEQVALVRMRALRGEGLSYKQIVAVLTAEGFRPRAKMWYASQVRKWLARGN